MSAEDNAQGAWWQQAFDASYLERYAHRDDQSAYAEVAGILPRLSQAPGPILDACCGNGRHLAVMRSQGLLAWGFDWSWPLLTQAGQRTACTGALLRADLRRLPLAPASLGAITLLFTAFGYFDEQENRGALKSLATCLRPGGWLVLDLPDPQYLRLHLQERSSRRLDNGWLLQEERWFEGPYVCKLSSWQEEDAPRQISERVRLYEEEELSQLASQAGLSLQERWPSLCGPAEDQHRHVYWLQS